MSFFDTMLEGVETMAIMGHIRPDGDCIGSCLAAYNYLEEHYPDVRVTVFLEEPSIKFGYLKNIGRICSDFSVEAEFDLCLCLDCSDVLRFGEAVRYLNSITPDMTAARLTNMLSETCKQLYMNKPGDDTTIATVKIVSRKNVCLYSGPPMDKSCDERLVTEFMIPEGKKIVCGGSSANIVSRVLKQPLMPSIEYSDPEIPPTATIAGIDLVTEGVITLKRTVDILKSYVENPTGKEVLASLDLKNGASQIAKMLIEDCTHLYLYIGQSINPAHQNPDLPFDLSIKMIILDELYSLMIKLGKVVKRYYY